MVQTHLDHFLVETVSFLLPELPLLGQLLLQAPEAVVGLGQDQLKLLDLRGVGARRGGGRRHRLCQRRAVSGESTVSWTECPLPDTTLPLPGGRQDNYTKQYMPNPLNTILTFLSGKLMS